MRRTLLGALVAGPGLIVSLPTSPTPLPGHQYQLDWRPAEGGGNWYHSADLDMEAWLCPLFSDISRTGKDQREPFLECPVSLYAQIRRRLNLEGPSSNTVTCSGICYL